MNDGELLTMMGTDAMKWMQECDRRLPRFRRKGALLGWMANALAAGESAGARPFGYEGQTITGHALVAALQEGKRMQVRFCTGGDTTWMDACRVTDGHPDGIPPEWYHCFGQINLVVREVDPDAV